MLERDNKAPAIHYTWIGPPPDNKGVRGHDVTCVKRMAEANQTNPIKFWCLQAQAQHYQDVFKGHPNIEICTVEAQLGEDSKSDKIYQKYAEGIQQMMGIVLSDGRDTVRDRVTIKDAFVTYLLMRHGGYTIDTNIEPMNGAKVHFPEQDVFKIARVHHVNHEDANDAPECFLMYMPDHADDKKRAQAVLNDYFTTVVKCEEERGKLGFDYEYTLGCAYILGLYNQQSDFFMGNSYTNDARDVFFDELGVVKHYFNTHKARFANTEMPMVFSAVNCGDIDRVKVMLQSGEDINKVNSTERITNESLLHRAVGKRNIPMIKLLLDAGANVNAVAHFSEVEQSGLSDGFATPLELARMMQLDDVVELLERRPVELATVERRQEEQQAINVYQQCDAAKDATLEALNDVLQKLEVGSGSGDRGRFLSFDPVAYLTRQCDALQNVGGLNAYDDAVVAALCLCEAYEKLASHPDGKRAAELLYEKVTSDVVVRSLASIGIAIDVGDEARAADAQPSLPKIKHNIQAAISSLFSDECRHLLGDHKDAISEYVENHSQEKGPKL